MNEEQVKRRRGRPSKSAADRGRDVTVYLPPDVIEWLKSQPEGMSKAIARLVRERSADN